MFRCLNTAMIHVDATPAATVELASRFGFQGCDLPVGSVDDTTALRRLMEKKAVRAGSANGLLAGRIAAQDDDWERTLELLPDRIRTARELGFTRSTVVVLPFHESLLYDACFDLHVSRLRQVAPPLADAGISIGLEYVSQLTRRSPYANEFIYNLRGTVDLLEAVDAENVGVLLDSFHWHCAGETIEDLRGLSKSRIVVVHVNDSIVGRALEDQTAFERELPGATGVIDIAGFLSTIRSTGYDGPVTAEPMSEALKNMDEEAALRAVAASMERIGV